ncbi:MAG: sulfide/dihydroorotate dehydrogenase-like FAD/NAD-binding protein [Actinobacteria bacterium]|nr:sulfide/dihydroorotate dehydrogenase-like FAD/NAD-binding protein [Actinomycetota bacterium]
MFEILGKRVLRPDVFLARVSAPAIARRAKPGQFVIVRAHEQGERIPLSLADIDVKNGTITLIFMVVGKTTRDLATFDVGDEIEDVVGPLGRPTDIERIGRVVLVGGGFGAAPLYPIGRAFKEAGNEVVAILGARSADLLVYEKELGSVSDRVLVTTDDGSKGIKGLVTDALKEVLDGAGLVMAVGPAIMMKFISLATKPAGVRTIVSLNPIMVDGTGMCGACRVSVGGETKFGCTDGPDFDGHLVDWELLMARQRTYLSEEKQSLEAACSCGGGEVVR